MRILAMMGLLALAACGADGEPERPAAATPGVSITGMVEVGITG
jgi:predicted small lipoprotein YifL